MSLQVWLPLLGTLDNQGVSDISVTNNGATITSIGKLGKCYTTNGSSQYITGTYTATANMSFCIWTKFNASFAGHLVDARVSDVGYQPMYVQSSRVQSGGSTGGYPDFSYSLTTGTWYHLCIVYTSNDVSLYVNGSLVGTSTGGKGYDYGDKEFTLCCRHSHNNYFIPADVQDFRIYDHSLSAKEVKEISKGMILHYPMTGGGRGQANLYTGTADFSGTWDGANNWTTDTTQTYKGFVVKKRNGAWGGLAQRIPATNGDIFTISFYAKVDSGGNVQSIHRSNLGNVTTGLNILGGNFSNGGTVWIIDDEAGDKWKYCWATVQIVSADITWLQWRIENSNSTTTMYICGFKMERGDKPTPWIPHTSDTQYTTMGYNNTTEYDTSGYLHNGTINGSVSYSSDTARYSVSTEFSKAGYINVPSFNVDTSAFTLNFWVKMKNATSQHFVLGTFNSWTGNGIGVYRDANAEWYSCLIRSAGESTYKSFSLYPTIGSWYMLTLTYDGTNYKGYLNGILKQNATYGSGGVVSNPVFMVGNSKFNSTPASENEEAFVSDVRFYVTCLDQEDITKLYNTSASLANNGTLMAYEFTEV